MLLAYAKQGIFPSLSALEGVGWTDIESGQTLQEASAKSCCEVHFWRWFVSKKVLFWNAVLKPFGVPYLLFAANSCWLVEWQPRTRLMCCTKRWGTTLFCWMCLLELACVTRCQHLEAWYSGKLGETYLVQGLQGQDSLRFWVGSTPPPPSHGWCLPCPRSSGVRPTPILGWSCPPAKCNLVSRWTHLCSKLRF